MIKRDGVTDDYVPDYVDPISRNCDPTYVVSQFRCFRYRWLDTNVHERKVDELIVRSHWRLFGELKLQFRMNVRHFVCVSRARDIAGHFCASVFLIVRIFSGETESDTRTILAGLFFDYATVCA